MIQLFVKSFRINIGVPFGVLNETKLGKIKEKLGDDFTIFAPTGGQAAFITNSKKHSVIVLAPNQLSFGFDGENVIPDFEYVFDIIQSIFDLVLLEPVGPSGIQIVGNYNASLSTMEDSFKFLTVDKDILSTGIKGLKGVGLRFLIDHEKDTWEYKVEPFIKNPGIWFAEAICGNNDTLPLTTVIEIAKEAYDYFVGDWRIITEESLIGRG